MTFGVGEDRSQFLCECGGLSSIDESTIVGRCQRDLLTNHDLTCLYIGCIAQYADKEIDGDACEGRGRYLGFIYAKYPYICDDPRAKGKGCDPKCGD